MKMILSEKFKHFLRYSPKNLRGECLEGQTLAGKTTVGIVKFILKCAKSKKMLHVISGQTVGIIEKNVINRDLGISDIFDGLVDYYPNGDIRYKLPHIKIKGTNKVIFICGYGDASKWKNILGGQFGCVFIDEVNIANIDFVRELTMRCDYYMFTLNPDNPELQIYKDFINRSRPLKEYVKDYPEELYNQILSEPEEDGLVHWFFKMDDNISLTEEKKEKVRSTFPKNTKQYKNKILGLRGKSEGLVVTSFSREKNVVLADSFEFKPNEYITAVICGLDSGLKNDATSVVPVCITNNNEYIILPTLYYTPRPGSNANSSQSEMINKYLYEIETKYFGGPIYNLTTIIYDSAALTQDLGIELSKTTNWTAYKVPSKNIQADTMRVISFFEKCSVRIIDDGYNDAITNQYRGNNDMLIIELENLCWDLKRDYEPEDKNNHEFDALKYALTYIKEIGGKL